jgi:hypothetical protein
VIVNAVTATVNTRVDPPVDLKALKGRQMSAWASGDYAVIGTTLQLLSRLNRGGPGSLVVPSEYLEVVITRR